MLFHLHHEVVQVDELGAHRQAAEGGLGQHLVEAVVVLDQLGKRPLEARQVSTVRGGKHKQREQRRRLMKMILFEIQ